MSIVSYNGFRLIPAPFVSVQKQYEKSADGNSVGARYSITITGTIAADKGSPNKTGVFYAGGGYPPDESVGDASRLGAIIRKQEAIRELFSEEGHQLEFQSFDGSPPMKCNPRINSIAFSDGQWYNTSQYTIECESDVLSVNGLLYGEDSFDQYVTSATEEWNIETSDDQPQGIGMPRTYRLTHSLQAQGKRFYDDAGTLTKPAWQQARDWVLPKLGFDGSFLSSSGVRDLPSYYSGFNHVRSESIDEMGGSYAVTETWILASGSATEDFTISTRLAADNGLVSVSIDGAINGYEQRNSDMTIVSQKYENAITKFTAASGLAYTRAQAYSGMSSLNIIPLSTSISRNPLTGTINYTFEYDNRQSNYVPGAKSEVISLNSSFDVDVFAAIPILGRTKGPLLQDMATKQARTRGLSIELAMEIPSQSGSSLAGMQSIFFSANPRVNPTSSSAIVMILDAANPMNTGATKAFVSQRNETWEPKSGRYSFNIEWTWE